MSIILHTDKTYVIARLMRVKILHKKLFTLKKFKTVEAAWKAAEAWEASMKKRLPSIMPRVERMTRSNTSGVVNVFPSTHVVRKKTGPVYEYPRWTARWKGCPNTGGVSWTATGNLDEDDAFVLAFLTHELRTVNRDKVRSKFEMVSKTKRYDEILKIRKA